jgi:penicillin amidase/acyl-homoserine-lactone acylase
VISFALALLLTHGGMADTTPPDDLSKWIPEKGRFEVEIRRDTYGVPHIYGKTDADCAYALAWAQCEDDFKTLYEVFHMVRARMSLLNGPSAAPIDFLIKVLRLEETIDAKYETDLDPKTRALCDAFAAGVNHYAATHPEEVKYWDEFPITGKDIVLGFMVKTPMFAGIDNALAFLREDVKPQNALGLIRLAEYNSGLLPNADVEIGSNSFAVSPRRSADGSTFLDVNSHQPFTGPVSWYECRLKSEEGLDVVGGVFPGGPFILHGHNRDLGWAMTVNFPDILDVYELTLNPRNSWQYEFDGEWRDFERYNYDVEARVWRDFTGTLKLRGFESIHGPVIHLGDKAYAVRYASREDVRMVEQWYRMNRATNMDQFVDALKMRAIPSLNITYADKSGNIMYLYNAALPLRAEGYDWKSPVPGNTSATLWTELLPFEKLPMVVNPESGFVQNCNGTPFRTTIGDDNPREEDYPAHFGIETKLTNRGLRLLELLGADESVTYDDFYNYKYDIKYSRDGLIPVMLQPLFDNPPNPESPLVQEGIALLKSFDFEADLEDRVMPLLAMTLVRPVLAELMGRKGPPVSETFMEGIEKLHAAFGRLDVRWGDVNLLERGGKTWPVRGGPDTLRCIAGSFDTEKKYFRANAGDSYVQLVRWDKNGKVFSEHINVYGTATQDESSPHYNDQSPIFAREEMKPTWFEEADLLANLECRYSPGEERTVGEAGTTLSTLREDIRSESAAAADRSTPL